MEITIKVIITSAMFPMMYIFYMLDLFIHELWDEHLKTENENKNT